MSRTTGLPKGSNSYGNRVSILPKFKHNALQILGRGTEHSATSKFHVGFGETRRNYSNSKNSLNSYNSQTLEIETISNKEIISAMEMISDLSILKKLADLNTRSQKYPKGTIDRNLYSMLLNDSIFYLAYDKLKSKPGNMTAGINPTTLDGISKE
jgi:hypothetical protein